MTRKIRTRVAIAGLLGVLVASCGGAADSGAQDADDASATEDATEATDGATDATDGATDSTDDGTDDGAATDTKEDTTDAPDDAIDDADDPDESGNPDDSEDGTDLEGIEVVPEGQELVLRIGEDVHVVGLLNPEGESFYRYATIWPGSTPDDLTIVAVTQAEGMYDLRWLTWTDGADSAVDAFPIEYQPNPEMASAADVAPIPVFSPDGRSLAWIDWDADGDVTLRTIGWDDGPGTGRTADDNASFGLDGLEAGVQLQTWEDLDAERSALAVLDDEGTTWTITLTRQADGALALEPDALQRD